MIKFAESGHPVFRATSPLSRGTLKSKGAGKLSIHFCADQGTIETVFRTIISVNQLSIHGAVSDLCEECKTCHVRTGRLVLAGQSDPLFVPTSLLTKTPTPSTNDPAQEDLLQKYQERVERLSQQNRVIKICTDAGFLTTVGVGQYLMTKDIDEFLQFTEPVWSTKSTTTTSRRPLKRRRNYLRWRRKYLLLQADQRLKQNRGDLPLLAHLQELYLIVKEYGWTLNLELNLIKRTQWQKD